MNPTIPHKRTGKPGISWGTTVTVRHVVTAKKFRILINITAVATLEGFARIWSEDVANLSVILCLLD